MHVAWRVGIFHEQRVRWSVCKGVPMHASWRVGIFLNNEYDGPCEGVSMHVAWRVGVFFFICASGCGR
jgi:hypothetical protein